MTIKDLLVLIFKRIKNIMLSKINNQMICWILWSIKKIQKSSDKYETIQIQIKISIIIKNYANVMKKQIIIYPKKLI